MLWSTLAPALLLTAGAARAEDRTAEKPPEEARQYLTAVEKNFLDAKALRAVVDVEEREHGKPPLRTIATFHIADQNRVRMEVVVVGDEKEHLTLVSDGRRLRAVGQGKLFEVWNSIGTQDLPKEWPYAANKIRLLARPGVLGVLGPGVGDPDKLINLDEVAEVSNVTFGPREKVGDREAQVLRYLVKVGRNSMLATAWVDVQTRLPLKRVFTSQETNPTVITETFRVLDVNPKLDPALFELPKK
jgi:hypothetical protein